MGPVPQPVFKTGKAWQPHAGSVRLRRRSVTHVPRSDGEVRVRRCRLLWRRGRRQGAEQVADGRRARKRMVEPGAPTDSVPVSAADTPPLDIAVAVEVAQDRLGRALRDPDQLGDVAYADVGASGDAHEDEGVVRQERTMRSWFGSSHACHYRPSRLSFGTSIQSRGPARRKFPEGRSSRAGTAHAATPARLARYSPAFYGQAGPSARKPAIARSATTDSSRMNSRLITTDLLRPDLDMSPDVWLPKDYF